MSLLGARRNGTDPGAPGGSPEANLAADCTAPLAGTTRDSNERLAQSGANWWSASGYIGVGWRPGPLSVARTIAPRMAPLNAPPTMRSRNRMLMYEVRYLLFPSESEAPSLMSPDSLPPAFPPPCRKVNPWPLRVSLQFCGPPSLRPALRVASRILDTSASY
jgi:hypothetical protein